MRLFVCMTVLSTALLGAFAFPADQSSPQIQKLAEGEKQQNRQSLFGVGIDLNLSKNGTLIPTPAFINTSASFGHGLGAGGNFLVPLVPFPLGLLFPHPPLNITVGFNTNKNISASLVASTGNNNSVVDNNDSGWGSESGWGWSTTPAPSGWSWGPPQSTPGWGPPPSTPGWGPPPVTEGWAPPPPPPTEGWAPPPPPPTEGWSAPESTTTEGWGWVEPTTSGWGWGVKKGLGQGKPQIPSAPKPNSQFKPPQAPLPVLLEGGKPSEAQSSLSSEIPQSLPSQNLSPLNEMSSLTVASPITSDTAPEPAMEILEAPEPAMEILEAPEPAMEILEAPAAAPVPEPLVEVPAVEAVAPAEAPAAEAVLENDNVKVSVPASKNKRHAEQPSALRIEDFEDVESPNEMNNPAIQQHMDQEMSKEEMIILAMEQGNKPGFANARPIAPLRPTLNQLHSKPTAEIDESVDVRNADSLAAQANDISKSVSKGKPESESSSTFSGRNKPRPYGMDKPSKSRPTLDKTEPFGLPHNYDLIQKEQYQMPGGSSTSSVLGFQVPDIKWSSFTNILQNFLGSSHKSGMAKSDAVSDKCIDEEDSQVVRAPANQLAQLCQSNKGVNSCHTACVGSGFESGRCLGASGPGCLCKIPNHKELGMVLSVLKAPVEEHREGLQTSASAPCKKCACAESCKGIGSYTGFCLDKCYCAVPWYTKVEN